MVPSVQLPANDEDGAPDPVLGTAQVGALFHVHPSTIKRWCDAGDLAFERTEGGHRRIRLSDVLEKARRDGCEPAISRFGPDAGAVWLAETAAVEREDLSPALELSDRWLHTGRFDEVGELVVHLVMARPRMLADILDRVVRDVMRGVGARWEEGSLRPGGEHLASEALLEALFRLRIATRAGGGGEGARPVALVGCTEGERHALGAHGIRLLLTRRGWTVRFAGQDVPLEEWGRLQREHGAELVCMSFSAMRVRGDILRALGRLSEQWDPHRPYVLAIGGGIDSSEISLPGNLPFRETRAFSGAADFAGWLDRRSRG